MNKYKKLITNTMILAAGTFASKLIVLLMMPFYTKLLSPNQFGTADLVSQTANMIIPIACIGIAEGLFRFALDCEDRRKVFSTAMTALFCSTAVMFAAIPILNLFDSFSGYVLLIGAYVACANFHSVAAHYVRAKGRTTLFAVQGIINTVLTVALNVLFLLVFDLGALGYVLSVVIADFTVTLIVIFAARLYRDFSIKQFDRHILKDLLKYCIPYIPTTMLWLITSVSDRYIVKAFCGIGETGLYAASYKIPTLLTLAAGVFIEAWQFSAVKDATAEERGRFFGTVYRSYTGAIFMAASVLIAGSRIFTSILLDATYYSAWQYVPVLVGATVFSTLVSFMGSVYFVEKKSVLSIVTALTGALINIVLNFILIPKYGAMGAAVATLISYIVVYAVRVINTKKYVSFNTHTVILAVNCLLICAQAVLMYVDIPYGLLVQIAMVAIITVFNLKGILGILREFLGSAPFLKRKNKNKIN